MQDARRFLETALGELRDTQVPDGPNGHPGHDGHPGCGGRRAARVAHLLQVALRAPGADALRRTIREIECCYHSQGRTVDLPSLKRLDQELAKSG